MNRYETPAERADLFAAVIEHIERVGLWQGGTYFEPPYERSMDASCCVLGAASVVGFSMVPGLGAACWAVMDLIEDATGHWQIGRWNDRTSEPEVMATLRRIRDDLRARDQAPQLGADLFGEQS